MSSTGRGRRGGGDAEFFATPPAPTRRILERLPDLPGGKWLEPTAGDGALIRVVGEFRNDIEWTAVELRAECRQDLQAIAAHVFIEPFQRWGAEHLRCWETTPSGRARPFKVAMLNPPFSQALAIVQLCLELADHVLCLQRTPWIGDSDDTRTFFEKHMPDDYRAGRVDFDGRGGDSIPCSWFHFHPDKRNRTRGEYEFLPRSSLAERKERGNLPPPRQVSLFSGESK